MLNWADYALLLVLAVSMAIGLWRGFVVEVLSLTVWVAAFWLAIAFGADASTLFTGVGAASAQLFLGYASVFLGVLLLGGLVTWAIGKLIANTGLSATDRVLGLGFGLARGIVLACVAAMLLGFTPVPRDDWWTQSRFMPSVQQGAEWMAGFLPPVAAQEIFFPVPGMTLPEPSNGPPPDADGQTFPET